MYLVNFKNSYNVIYYCTEGVFMFVWVVPWISHR
jgi:hypothetical protein